MDTIKTINIQQKAEKLKDYFSPKIISEVNNEYVKSLKLKGKIFRGIIMKTKMSFFILSMEVF